MASCRALMTSTFQLESWTKLHGFNTGFWNKVSWSIKHILDLPKYKYSAFCQKISELHKIVTYVPNKWITYVLTLFFTHYILLSWLSIGAPITKLVACWLIYYYTWDMILVSLGCVWAFQANLFINVIIRCPGGA